MDSPPWLPGLPLTHEVSGALPSLHGPRCAVWPQAIPRLSASVLPPMRWGCDRSVPGARTGLCGWEGEQTQGCAPAGSWSGLSGAPGSVGGLVGHPEQTAPFRSLSRAPRCQLCWLPARSVIIVSVPTPRGAHPPECRHWGRLKPANSWTVAAREPGRAWASPSFQGR